jgi:uncharacterized surface protein with fasciclin (FAS1) repeats
MASILETAASVGVFNTLLAAVDAAGLRGALEGPGPFTVFAPVDDAFAALPPGTVQTLVDNPPQLARISNITCFQVPTAASSSWLKTTGTASRVRRFRSAAKIPSR